MYMTLTHSARAFNFERASLNFLTRRYAAPDRLKNLPAFQDLDPFSAPKYLGNLTVWDLNGEAPKPVSFLEGTYKIQHAILYGPNLIICGLEFLEIIDINTRAVRRLSDPWFQDGHTVFPDGNGKLLVACAASDAVLVFNLHSGKVERRLRIPDGFYGSNYELTPEHDLRLHQIPNDYQLTHMNCAFPTSGGILISGLIPGAVGLFSNDGGYRELAGGFIGLHGVRTRPGLNGFYFADSCTGNLVEMDSEGRIIRRFGVDSSWLHDVQWLRGEQYLFSLSDRNRVELWDVSREELIWTLDAEKYGATVQFLSVTDPATGMVAGMESTSQDHSSDDNY